jgi:ATP-dependent Lhr-like helicase
MGPLLEANDRPGLQVLWVTPLRALAADTADALRAPLRSLGISWDVETRTGDSSSATRARQWRRLPAALVTTPESLSLLLSRADAAGLFSNLQCVVVDEWHELLSSKRGTQTELALARLRRWRRGLRTWGLSATLGNLDEALAALVGTDNTGRLVRGHVSKPIRIDTILPAQIHGFPWAGRQGLRLLPEVIAALDESRSALVFTNTRNQAETWFQAIRHARPDLAVALHHGSLDRAARAGVEEGLREGRLRCVVCTSSLDLGVDFTPVDRVLQVGSPKGVARLIQRAGRSGHQPGVESRVTCVPTHALELVESAAARDAAAAGRIEARPAVAKPLDVLAQHLVTVALGGGFRAEELLAEVRSAHSYRDLTDAEWAWTLDFVTRGGESLKAYPAYRRVVESDRVFTVPDRRVARRHRLSIGTITADAAMQVRLLRGGRLGSVEEAFVARLRPGDRFLFAGRSLELVMVNDMTAWVRRTAKPPGTIPRWAGGRMPLSSELAASVRQKLDEARRGIFAGPEMRCLRPVWELQMRRSALPAPDELLIERLRTREGHHLFFFPFEGRLVHEGLAALWAYRLSRLRPISFTLAVNDYGVELLAPDPPPLEESLPGLLSPEGLADDIPASLNAAELARRQFREIARVAGLVFSGYPGSYGSTRQFQASAGLFYDVFANYDPGNPLLHQAHREVLDRQLEVGRLRQALERLRVGRVRVIDVEKPTPLAFPILVDRMRQSLSSESLAQRVERMQMELERPAPRKRARVR